MHLLDLEKWAVSPQKLRSGIELSRRSSIHSIEAKNGIWFQALTNIPPCSLLSSNCLTIEQLHKVLGKLSAPAVTM